MRCAVPSDRALEQVVQDIADGSPVDWDLCDSRAQEPEDREYLKWLRVLGNIAELHRSDHVPADPLERSRSADAAAAADAAAEAPVRMWGRFRLEQKVGEGSFGSVYRAWDPQLEREIAIKILHGHFADTAVAERLLREGRALARIRHPNVVSVLGVESNKGQIGLCMDFVRGQTLEDVLHQQGTFGAAEAVVIGQDVCRALAAVHRAGLVHRDVKARNVMRERAGRIVLMDFGTGREARQLQEAPGRDVSGTPLYMAPEVLAGGAATPPSDVYSLGVLLYHLVTGEYPVEAGTLDDLKAAHREGRRRFASELRPDLPPAFVRVLERALATEPNARYPNAGAFLDALSGIFASAEPAPPPTRSVTVLAGVTVAAAAVTLGSGVLTSGAFNATLERSAFASDTIWDWWRWGLKAHVGPAFILILGCIATATSLVVVRLALRLSPQTVRLQDAAGRWARRGALDDASVLGSWVLILSSSALVSLWWYFWPLIVALCSQVSTAPIERLALLSPAFETYQDLYVQSLSALLILAVLGWYGVHRVAASAGQPVNLGLLSGGAAVIVLTLASLDAPYRLFVESEFEAATWNGAQCYVIGERPDAALLFCPELAPPRNRVVQRDSGTVQRLGRRENVFTRSHRPGGEPGTGASPGASGAGPTPRR
jgi:hypothetical protein